MIKSPHLAGAPDLDSTSSDQMRACVFRLLQEIGGFDPVELQDTARFDKELLMKSVDFVEFRVAIEDQFDIEVDPLMLIELNRLGRVVTYLSQLAAKRTA